jgi:hypothetical protein
MITEVKIYKKCEYIHVTPFPFCNTLHGTRAAEPILLSETKFDISNSGICKGLSNSNGFHNVT